MEYNNFENNLFNQVNYKPEVFIANLIKNLEVKHSDEHIESIFFVDKDSKRIWMVYEKHNGCLYVSHKHIWLRIQSSFPHKDPNISELIKYVVGIVFKINVKTTIGDGFLPAIQWELISK